MQVFNIIFNLVSVISLKFRCKLLNCIFSHFFSLFNNKSHYEDSLLFRVKHPRYCKLISIENMSIRTKSLLGLTNFKFLSLILRCMLQYVTFLDVGACQYGSKTVSNIRRLSPTHVVSNIHHCENITTVITAVINHCYNGCY